MSSNHYVNNADFLAAIKDYRAQVEAAVKLGDEKPRLSNYIGECILKIATHLSYKPNFINYTYREEMISDGIENCLMYIDNFDPAKSSNPFAYFTQIIYYAFIRRIQKEKKQTLIKGKIVMDMPFELFEVQDQDEDGSFASSYIEFMQNNGVFNDILEQDEKRKAKAKAKRQAATLDDIIESE
jgi:DNA-directed RNA polymerase specialized sigma24 family protein